MDTVINVTSPLMYTSYTGLCPCYKGSLLSNLTLLQTLHLCTSYDFTLTTNVTSLHVYTARKCLSSVQKYSLLSCISHNV